MSEEKSIWRGCSSGVLYLGTYLLCGLILLSCLGVAIYRRDTSGFLCAGFALIPLQVGFSRWLNNRNRIYTVTTQRIRVTTGVLSKVSQELELYRVKDMTVVQPFLYRLLKCGNLILTTNDASTPTLVIEAVPDIENLHEALREAVETCRDQKHVHMNELE